jgi:hypothetical protein
MVHADVHTLYTYERELGGGGGEGRERQRVIKWMHTCCMCGQELVEDDSVEERLPKP